MKILILIILLLPLTLYSQKTGFEGTIWFSITYEASDTSISEDQLKMYGDQAVFLFRHRDFKKEYKNAKK